MFIKDAGGGYNRHGEQFGYGWFLLVFQRTWQIGREPMPRDLRACVRYAHLTQSGHFMTGIVTVGKHRIFLSGSYGGDGLPKDAPDDLWPLLHPLPDDLVEAFWSGGGHNSAGAEAPALRAWALAHFTALHAAGSARYITLTKRRTHGAETQRSQRDTSEKDHSTDQ